MATGVGGGARDAKMTRIYQRDTTDLQRLLQRRRATPRCGGAFEAGKVDNIYSLYEAGGVKWMVLVLELWPRKAAVDWAKSVVASHPDHNVIMVTHDYLDGAGGLGQNGRLRRHQPAVPVRQPDQPVPEHQDDRARGHVGCAARQGLHRQERQQDLLVPDHDPLRRRPTRCGCSRSTPRRERSRPGSTPRTPTRPTPAHTKTITGVDFVNQVRLPSTPRRPRSERGHRGVSPEPLRPGLLALTRAEC